MIIITIITCHPRHLICWWQPRLGNDPADPGSRPDRLHLRRGAVRHARHRPHLRRDPDGGHQRPGEHHGLCGPHDSWLHYQQQQWRGTLEGGIKECSVNNCTISSLGSVLDSCRSKCIWSFNFSLLWVCGRTKMEQKLNFLTQLLIILMLQGQDNCGPKVIAYCL